MVNLITGANGFIGWHLARHLLEQNETVHGFGEADSAALDGIQWHRGSVLDRDSLAQAVADIQPDVIFHLAAKSLPTKSWKEPGQTFAVNIEGTLNLFEAILRSEFRPHALVIAGSSAEYAAPRDGHPIGEGEALSPGSPYGVSKLAVSHLARLYHARYQLPAIVARPFFLIGPRKTGDVCSDFARGIVAIEKGLQESLPVGNLEVVRDMLDVRDGAAALALIARNGIPGQCYNICSGSGTRLSDVLEIYRGLASVSVRLHTDPKLLRPIDEPVKVGNPARLCALGWTPRYSLPDALKSILDYWRSSCKS